MDADVDHAFEDNKRLWNAWTAEHLTAYDSVQTVRAGGLSIRQPDLAEVGSVAGKSLLHLQCHFGLDTLSWARLGASVVGVDFAPAAIAAARDLAAEVRLDAEFVEANIYDLPSVLPRQFDIVYTSYGVLWWLPDLSRWAQIVAGALRPGGMFYMCEIHPFGSTLRDEDGRLVAAEEYFGNGSPLTFQVTGSYIQGVAVEEQTEHGWQHSMGEIVTSLLDAGLRIEWLHEFPFACFKMLPSFTSDDDRNWWPPEGSPRLPLLFSVRAYRT